MKELTYNECIKYIDDFLLTSGKKYYSEFYIGITNDVNRRLFQEHNVDRKKTLWAYATATSKDVAEQVEQYYLGKRMQGDTGGGTPESKIVYCYATTPTTIE